MERSSLRSFFILWTGQAISVLGSQAVQFALIWWLTIRTGSATVLAAAAFVGLLPQVALGPFIGALVDRWNRKKVMLLADSAVAVASAGQAAVFLLGEASTAEVLGLLLLRSLGSAFHEPAMMASTSLMVPAEHLTRIQGLNQALLGGQLIVSAPLGALLVASLPMAGVMAVDVITALFAVGPLWFIAVPQPTGGGLEAGLARKSTTRDVLDGLRYLRRRPGHLTLLGMAAVINLCLVPAYSLLPLLVLAHGSGPAELGWMSSLFGAGTVAGGIALGIWGGFATRIHTVLAAMIGVGVATAALGWTSTLAGACAAIAAVGLMVPMVNGPIQALLQATVHPELQGRIFTLYGSLAGITAPLGLALATPLAEWFGVRFWYDAGGLACVAMGLGGFLAPVLRTIEDVAAPEPRPADPPE